MKSFYFFCVLVCKGVYSMFTCVVDLELFNLGNRTFLERIKIYIFYNEFIGSLKDFLNSLFSKELLRKFEVGLVLIICLFLFIYYRIRGWICFIVNLRFFFEEKNCY